ncbi:hypothetical protein BDW22DRAFT_875151 [Trametopsis cervina]|nr:hypothetical protein BDW22DRAFT_875151 [Trametopsis cervina]
MADAVSYQLPNSPKTWPPLTPPHPPLESCRPPGRRSSSYAVLDPLMLLPRHIYSRLFMGTGTYVVSSMLITLRNMAVRTLSSIPSCDSLSWAPDGRASRYMTDAVRDDDFARGRGQPFGRYDDCAT